MIPDKTYFKIGEVAELAGVEPYVLRYWESEFREICPVKSKSKQRLYRKKDIETVFLIKSLLYTEGFTIEGARKRIKETRGDKEDNTNGQLKMTFDGEKSMVLLRKVKKELEEVLRSLEKS